MLSYDATQPCVALRVSSRCMYPTDYWNRAWRRTLSFSHANHWAVVLLIDLAFLQAEARGLSSLFLRPPWDTSQRPHSW
jgi:hypothetical protein